MAQIPIEIKPDVMMGKPVIAGTRITVELILEKLAAGETIEQIVDALRAGGFDVAYAAEIDPAAADDVVKAQWTSTNRRSEPHVAERGGSACQAIPEKLPDREVLDHLVDMGALSV